MVKADKKHIIKVENLVKRYRKSKTNSVDDVSFYVEQGAFFSLLGPNGAGKTTIISILTTLLNPTSGKVLLDDFNVSTQADLIRRQIGVIFQKPSLDANLTAEENIRFHANLYNLYPYRPSFNLMPESYRNKVSQLADILGIGGSLASPVKTLSGGMKRKLEIVRSLMHQPKILFLDEPTTGLDPVSRRNLWNYLQKVRESENITIFLTTHYLEEAEGSDYVCVIDEGKIVSQGTPAQIKSKLIELYMTVDSLDRPLLTQHLDKLKLKYTGKGPFKVYAGAHTFQDLITKLPRLSFLDIHNPTLEEAYLEIIKN